MLIFLKATAGLRLLSVLLQTKVLQILTAQVIEYGFTVGDDFGVISGVKEAMYAWVTVASHGIMQMPKMSAAATTVLADLADLHPANPSSTSPLTTMGTTRAAYGGLTVLDLGGGSTQLAREFVDPPPGLSMNRVVVHGKTHHVLCASFLGLGMNAALQSAVTMETEVGAIGQQQQEDEERQQREPDLEGHVPSYVIGRHPMKPFPEACRPEALNRYDSLQSSQGAAASTKYEQCMQLMARVLAPFRAEVERLYPPLDAGVVVGISGLWHLARELLNITDKTRVKVHLSPAALERQAMQWCADADAWSAALDETPAALRVDPCFKACYVLELLHAYGVPRDKDVQIMDRVNWGHGFILQTAEHGLKERAVQSGRWFWQNNRRLRSKHATHARGNSNRGGGGGGGGGGGRGVGGNAAILIAALVVLALFGSVMFTRRIRQCGSPKAQFSRANLAATYTSNEPTEALY